MSTFRDRALRVIKTAFGGLDSVSGIKWGVGACMFVVWEDRLATYNPPGLSALVVACHEECVRGSLVSYRNSQIKIHLAEKSRKHRRPATDAHPTIEQHIEQIRRGGSYQPLWDQLTPDGQGGVL